MKTKYIFPKFRETTGGDSITLSTTVRIKRNKIWYEVFVSNKFPRKEDDLIYTPNDKFFKAEVQDVAELFNSAYKVMMLYKIDDKNQRGVEISTIQMSEKSRIELLHHLPLISLENLI